MRESRNLTEGPIVPSLVRFAFPIALAMLLQVAYGAVDLMVVGRFGQADNVSAVSNGAQVMQLVTLIVNDLALGTTILIGRSVGRKDERETGLIIGSSLKLFLFLGLLFMLVLQPLAPVTAKLLKVPSEAVAGYVRYVRICALGMPAIVGYNLVCALFRGMGNSVLPLITVAIACVCNIFGDLLLVGVFHMAEAGAALATVLSQALSVVVGFILLKKSQGRIPVGKGGGRIIRQIVKLGTPVALQDFLVTLSFLVISAIVNSLGVDSSASVGIAEKICGFLMLVPSSMGQAMSAYVAQADGAGKRRRVFQALCYGIAIGVVSGVGMAMLSFFGGYQLSMLFTTDAQVAYGASQYLDAYAVDCFLTAFLFCLIGYATGLGHTMFVLLQGLLGAFCVRIPVSLFMSREVPPSLFHIGLATPASSLIQILSFLLFFLWLRRAKADSSRLPGSV